MLMQAEKETESFCLDIKFFEQERGQEETFHVGKKQDKSLWIIQKKSCGK